MRGGRLFRVGAVIASTEKNVRLSSSKKRTVITLYIYNTRRPSAALIKKFAY